MKPRRVLALLAPTVAAIALVACSSDSSESSTSDTSLASPNPQAVETTADFNDDDVMFAQMMIPHHEQAIELADIALDPAVGASNDVRELATNIKSAQDPEIAQMTSLLAAWGQPLTADPNIDHGSMMKGMLSVEELASLGALTGTDFDRAWLEAMIAHHEGAIEMAEDVRETGVNPDIAKLADAVSTTQSSELSAMTSLLQE